MTKRPRRNQAVIITVLIILAIAVITIFVFRSLYNNNPQPTADDDTATSTAPTASSDSDTADESTTTDTPVEPQSTDDSNLGTPTQYEGDSPNDSATIEAALTYYGIQGSDYIVNINISQYLSGTCYISLGNYTSSVAIDQSAASSACSFHIPVNQLNSGLQKLKVDIKSGSLAGAVEETIDVSL